MNELLLEQIDYRYILVDNYKSLGLNEYDLAVILTIDNILKKDKILITAELLTLKMNLSTKDIDTLLVSLTSRGFLEYVSFGNSLVTSLQPTYDKILNLFKSDVVRMVDDSLNRTVQEGMNNLYLVIQKEIGRTLSPIEIEKVREWIAQDVKENVVVDCIRECKAKYKKVTINQINKAIEKYVSSRDIEKEGYSIANDKWKKDLEATINIANVKWTSEDE